MLNSVAEGASQNVCFGVYVRVDMCVGVDVSRSYDGVFGIVIQKPKHQKRCHYNQQEEKQL